MTDAAIRQWAVEHITANIPGGKWTDIIGQADKLAQYVISGTLPKEKDNDN